MFVDVREFAYWIICELLDTAGCPWQLALFPFIEWACITFYN